MEDNRITMKKKQETFKIKGPDGAIHEIPNKYLNDMKEILQSGGDPSEHISLMKSGGWVKAKGKKLKRAALGDNLESNQEEQNALMQQQNMLAPPTDPLQQEGNPFIQAMGSNPAVGTTLDNQDPNSWPVNTQINGQNNLQGLNPGIEQPTRATGPTTIDGIKKKKREAYDPYYLKDYYVQKGIDFGNTLEDSRTEAGVNGRVHRGAARAGIAGAVIGKTMETGKLFANVFSTINKNINERKFEAEQQQAALRDGLTINPFKSDDSQLGGGTRAMYSKYGGKIKMAHGGIIDLNGPDNVEAEGGEGFNDGTNVGTTQGPSHAQGGIKIQAPGDTVFHSKQIGINLGDLTAMASSLPGGDYMNSKLMEKYKDPDKEISFADATKPFVTTKKKEESLDKKILKLKEKAEYALERSSDYNFTRVDRITNKLNAPQIATKAKKLEEEKQKRLFVTGPEGPLHLISESLKNSGAYGKDIKEEAKAEYGKKIPLAQDGIRLRRKRAKNFQMPDFQNTTPAVDNTEQTYYGQPETIPVKDPVTGVITQAPVGETYLPPNIGGGRSIAGTNYAQPDIAHMYDLFYEGKDLPRVDQRAMGYERGFNTSGWMNNPEGFMQALTYTGFAPEDWSKVDNPQIQKHLMEVGMKPENEHLMKGLYDEFLQTNQGVARSGKKYTKPWSTLTPQEKSDWFEDGYNGIRTDFATRLLQPKAAKANKDPEGSPAKDSDVEKHNLNIKPGDLNKRRIYHEGLDPMQISANIMDLLTPIQAVPYIEDQGAKNAFAASTKQRYTDIQPQLNRLRRGTLAQTRFRGGTPVEQARQAQAYANEYEAANQVYGQKYNADAQIEQNYTNMQNELMMKAGTNKAQALDTLAQRTATRDWKDYALRRNAIGEIGNKFMQQRAEDRASALYQDMFPQYGYDPISGGTDYQGNWAPQAGLAKLDPMAKLSESGKYEVTQSINADGTVSYTRKLKTAAPSTKKYGGKIKLPKMLPKKR